jgi:hypothetical protein
MASINKYKKITKADTKVNQEGGYKNVVMFAPVNTATTWAVPVATPTLLGQKVTIPGDHIFPTDEGFMSLHSKKDSVTITGETTGDAGAQSIVWTLRHTILGDSASTQEQLQEMLNDDLILLAKDQDCIAGGGYVQLGDECTQPNIKVSFDGKTTAEGLKEYTLEATVKNKKFWYEGTVTEKP